MKRWLGSLLLLALAYVSPAAAVPVDLELILAVDVSRSIDAEEAQLQRQGYLEALRDPRVYRAIKSGEFGQIAIAYVEWAGVEFQFITIDWTLISTPEDLEAFAAKLEKSPRLSLSRTSVSGAIDFCVPMFFNNGFEGRRMVIDVSGDGRNNSGRPAYLARNDAVGRGITINGLPIMDGRPNFGFPPERDLDLYYEAEVIGGPGAFMVIAKGFDTFAQAILAKLIREIAERPGLVDDPG
jgi:hypothetical protein